MFDITNKDMSEKTSESSQEVLSLRDYLFEKHGPTIRTADVADYLHCHQSHVRAMCQDGELPAIKIGSRWFIKTIPFAQMLDGDDAYVG